MLNIRRLTLFSVLLITGCSFGSSENHSKISERFEAPGFYRNKQGNWTSGTLAFEKFYPSISMQLSKLPQESSSQVAFWPSYYWPRAKGGFKAKIFSSSLSPAEKLVNSIRSIEGEQAALELDKAIDVAQGDASIQPDWAGYCNNNVDVPAFFPEPMSSKSIGEVQFRAFEQKAILALNSAISAESTESDLRMLYIGSRNFSDTEPVGRGRSTDLSVRDANPGAFHLAIMNFLNSPKHQVAIDLSLGREVFIFGIQKAKIISMSQTSAPDRLQKVKPLNSDVVSLVDIKLSLSLVDSHRYLVSSQPKTIETTLEYTLELDGRGKIIGGEWQGESIEKHPDFVAVTELPSNLKPIIHPLLKNWFDAMNKTPGHLDNDVDLQTHPDANIGIEALEKYLSRHLIPSFKSR